MSKFRTSLLAAAFAAAACGTALAGDVTGVWMRSDGKTKVQFSPCGAAVCGVVAWNEDKNAPAHIGQHVFNDMRPAGENEWSGSAFNPEDGKTYSGKMSLAGNILTTSGCALGGLICKSMTWSRSN